ncbi:NDP-hexose 2,3-dehydratase family protein [Actinokineospora bangkokensis]|uniref:NDP-hexose 2,3-dehydratase n=1 Tax=Actinokineospora bangkokensis TaxID=1193682 RepID=A0A1Q9LP62_9PSEU|nr:NDP-hexose 2,3-dehydratase family protein [Actinokineospora bangkokensis]OLR93793.1 NDP-hexose 2,3-dehydratase [Actinokineospora bangkokensis]
MERHAATGLLRKPDGTLPHRLARSAATLDGATPNSELADWIAERNAAHRHEVTRIRFDQLRQWHFDPAGGDLRHDSGRFFRVQGLSVRTDYGHVRHWTQPIINQPEIGILGILVREVDGVLHCLMQAKSEPGNVNGVQLSPTVQATKSNYTRVHGGKPVPYLDFFRDPPPEQVLADVLQSEQGSWFYRKRNRNMVVEVTDDPRFDDGAELPEDFRWLTLGQLHALLRVDNLVNMDARTVLSCMPAPAPAPFGEPSTDLADAVARSAQPTAGGLHTTTEVMSWITSRQAAHYVDTTAVPLHEVRGWRRTDAEISHELGLYFSIVAVDITTNGREVASWSQPLVRPFGTGVVALLVKRVEGVLHALVNARVEPGYLDVVELAPTVQCTPENYDHLPPGDHPPFLDVVRASTPEQVLFSTQLSEEGGRFYHAHSEYQIIEVAPDFPDAGLADFRWLTVHQLNELLRHSHYVNVQARSLLACLRGLR